MGNKENEYFPEHELEGPAWCIDGRPDENSEKGPQMPGGSAFPIIVSLIIENKDINEENIKEKHNLLKEAGYKTGAHRGSHKKPEENKSDCAFLDKLPEILTTTVQRKKEITDSLQNINKRNENSFGMLSQPFADAIQKTFNIIESYPLEKIKLTGEKVVSVLEKGGAVIENLEGDHRESSAFINIKENVTFDTNQANKEGVQTFNLDLTPLVEQTNSLGVDRNYAVGFALVLYQSVNIVLAESKGAKPLQIQLHK
jgi:hypothetical protein